MHAGDHFVFAESVSSSEAEHDAGAYYQSRCDQKSNYCVVKQPFPVNGEKAGNHTDGQQGKGKQIHPRQQSCKPAVKQAGNNKELIEIGGNLHVVQEKGHGYICAGKKAGHTGQCHIGIIHDWQGFANEPGTEKEEQQGKQLSGTGKIKGNRNDDIHKGVCVFLFHPVLLKQILTVFD